MGDRSDRSNAPDGDSTERSRSIGYELLVWVLVASPFGFLGVTVIDAIVASGQLSRTGAIVFVVGLAVAGSFLVRDVHPSLVAAIVFLVVDQILLAFLYYTGQTVIFAGPMLSAWEKAGLQALAIAVAAVVAFTHLGRGNEAVARIVRRLLRLPPADPSATRSGDDSTDGTERT